MCSCISKVFCTVDIWAARGVGGGGEEYGTVCLSCVGRGFLFFTDCNDLKSGKFILIIKCSINSFIKKYVSYV